MTNCDQSTLEIGPAGGLKRKVCHVQRPVGIQHWACELESVCMLVIVKRGKVVMVFVSSESAAFATVVNVSYLGRIRSSVEVNDSGL
jgi:hypothetical protein